MRRALEGHNVGSETETRTRQGVLAAVVVLPRNLRLFEYTVLLTSLPVEDLLAIAQRYHLCGDADSIFDESNELVGVDGFRNAGFAVKPVDGEECRIGVRPVEFVGEIGGTGVSYRSGDEAAALVYGVAKWPTHGDLSKVAITNCNRKTEVIVNLLVNVNRFISGLLPLRSSRIESNDGPD